MTALPASSHDDDDSDETHLIIGDTMHHQLVRLSLSCATGSLRLLDVFGSPVPGVASGELKCPAGVAAFGDVVYVMEIGNTRLQTFCAHSGQPIDAVGTYGRPDDGEAVLRAPSDVALGGRDGARCYVTDTANNRVVVFEDAASRAANRAPSLARQTSAATAAVFKLYSAMSAIRRTHAKPSGAHGTARGSEAGGRGCEFREVLVFGEAGDAPGAFCGPTGIAVARGAGASGGYGGASGDGDADGDDDGDGELIFVADRYNHRVQCFAADGSVQRVIGSGVRGDGPAEFKEPFGVACAGGLVYVSEWHGGRVQVLTMRGECVHRLAPPRAGQLGGICLLGASHALVLEPMSGILHLLSRKPPSPPSAAMDGAAAAFAGQHVLPTSGH